MAASDENASHRLLAGRYRLVRRLGQRGRSSTVHEAIDTMQDRTVAVKLLDANAIATPDLHDRFRQAAEQLVTINHPNIVAVYDYGVEAIDGVPTPFLVMELLTGGSLRAILDRGRTLSPSQALLIGLDLCRGLDHAHRRGLVHGDVKPSNMLFGEDRRLKLADFSLSRLVGQALGHRANNLDLTSARYASPEQAQDQRLDGRSDVYSVALALAEAVTGQVPFAGDTTVATLANRVDRLFPVSADLGALAAVLERAGRANPAERSSAADLGRGLMGVAQQMPRPAPLALVVEGTSLFDAPPGQETTTELTRFADPTGQLRREERDPSGAIPRDPTAPVLRDHTGAIIRDSEGLLPRDPTGAPPRDPSGATRRDSTGGTRRDPSGALTRPRDTTGATSRPRVVALDEHGVAKDAAPSVGRRPIITWMLLAVGVIVAGALALVAYRKLNVPEYEVPVLAGMEEGQANNEIAPFEWVVTVRGQRSDAQPQGNILSTDPPAGTKLKKGAPFLMVVSEGPTLSALPDVNGETFEAAEQLLAGAGLTAIRVEDRFSEDVPPGVVMLWTVAAQPELGAGSEVVKGTAVDIIVSKGPRPRDIPDLTDVVFADAKLLLETQGVVVSSIGEDFSDVIVAGKIISQSVAAGGQVERGATVEVMVSKGPDLVALPSLSGLGFDAAKAAIEASGFTLGTYTGNYFTGTVTGIIVDGTAVLDAQPVRRASVVDLVFVT